MGDRASRPVTWVEIAIAIAIAGLIILTEGSGELAQVSSLILRAIGVAIFVLFAVWFSRAVYLSVRGAPNYALFGYSMLAFTLFSWGFAFFYPFPLHQWRDLILRDLAFYAGVPAPFVLLLVLAAVKALFFSTTRERLSEALARMRQSVAKMLLAAILMGWFIVWCSVQTWNDIRDLYSQPQTVVDTFDSYYRARTGCDTVTFGSLGTLRMPHGFRIKSLERNSRYQIAFTPHGRLLLGVQPEFVGPATSQTAQSPETFVDSVSGFTVTKPAGWYMEKGEPLRERAQEEAQRSKNPAFAPSRQGSPGTLLVRLTRYAPGQAPGPNPTIVATRLDLSQFPPNASADDLLRIGLASAKFEAGPTAIRLGGHLWQMMRATRMLAHSGKTIEAVQEAYVTKGEDWAIGVTITALREQYAEYRRVFDGILNSMSFK